MYKHLKTQSKSIKCFLNILNLSFKLAKVQTLHTLFFSIFLLVWDPNFYYSTKAIFSKCKLQSMKRGNDQNVLQRSSWKILIYGSTF